MRSIAESFNTNGSGFHSNEAKVVQIKSMDVARQADGAKFGELRIFFDVASWDTEKDGLIYTDKQFLADAKDYLTRAGYDASELHYSEYGMQGDDFVSFDVDGKFLATWNAPRR